MRVLSLLSVSLLFAITACNTARIVDRGVEGGAMFGMSSKNRTLKNYTIQNATNVKTNQNDFTTNSFTNELSTEKATDAANEQKSVGQIPMEKPVKTTIHRTTQETKEIKHNLRHAKQTFANNSGKDNPDEGSLRWFVYLILCFIIPPFAYFLVKRESDTLFWVCFICYLLAISFLGGFRYGILGLLSIVIALLALFQIDI